MARNAPSSRGFSLIELMLAMAVFLVICGAMFALLQLSQQRYTSESQMSGSFQEARLAIDQIARDVNDAGYPAQSMYSQVPSSATLYAIGPFAWDPNYPTVTPASSLCKIGSTCTTPGDFDLIIETMVSGNVSWIRYKLGTDGILYRGVTPKTTGDPVSATDAAGVLIPFLVNVKNNASGAELDEIVAQYPSMFPSGNPVPIFQYMCDTPTGVLPCPNAVPNSYNSPLNVRDVNITLIVETQQPDAETHQLKVIELNGSGHRLNP
jgi:prepilin-type N-terminal cleavage/methylation domain-containing protein